MPGRVAIITKDCVKIGKDCYNKCRCGQLKHWKSRRCTICYHADTRKQLSRIEHLRVERRKNVKQK